MPRDMVERTLDNGLHIPVSDEGGAVSMSVVGANGALGVTRVSSFVSDDESKTICVYDGLDSEAIRIAAERNGLPVDRITRISVLDPYFYR
jgi:hypothetical protein